MTSAWTIATLAIACVFAGALAATFLRGQSVRLLRGLAALLMSRTMADRVFIGAVFVALWIAAGTKPGDGGVNRGALPAASLSAEDFQRGFVLARAGTNETFDFSAPSGATVCADWKAFGAAEDWFYLTPGNWAFPFGDNAADRFRVHSDGWVEAFPSANPATGWEGSAPSVSARLWPLSAPLGIVPEDNWHLVGGNGEWGTGDGSQFWHFLSPSNTLRLTWQNALLNRDTNTLVSVQAELWPNGRFAYRYSTNTASLLEGSGGSVAGGSRTIGTSLGGHAWTTNALPANATSLAFFPLSAEDAVNPDRDGDGLSLADELFTYATDPDLPDSDFDGLGDGEEVSLGANPLSRDSDGDGLPDATDPRPLDPDSWGDLDGNGIPDVWENGWFGTNAAVAASGDANGDGVPNLASLMMGLNPVAPPPDGFAFTGASLVREINAWEIVPVAFSFDRPAGLSNLVSRTFEVNRESPWEQFFVSSRPDCAAGWEMADAALLYGLDDGPATNAAPAVSYGSWRVPLGGEMPPAITFRLVATGGAPSLSAPLYLLRWTPRIEILPSENVSVIAGTNGHVYAAAKRDPDTGAFEVPFRADTSRFPHLAGIDSQTAADLALPPADGVAVSNGIPRMFMANDPLMADLPPEGANPSKRLLFYSVDLERSGAVSSGPRQSRYASPYPLTSSALRKSFHVASGATSDGSVTLTLSPGIPELGFSARRLSLRGGAPLRGTTSGGSNSVNVMPPASGSPTVCGEPCTNDVYDIGFEYPEDHDSTPAEDDGHGGDEEDECECGDDGGTSLGSFRIRVPFGESAFDENLGYLWAVVDGPVAIRPSVFGVLAAPSVSVVTNANGTLHISCPSAGGKTLMVTNIAHGVAIPVWNASGRFESQWEVWNEEGDPSRIRVRRVTVLGNATVDETYAVWEDDAPVVFWDTCGPAAVWEKSDNIRGVTKARHEWRDEEEPDFVSDEYDETFLDGSLVRAELRTYAKVGEGAAARRRLVRTYGYDENGWYETVRAYWCDTDHPGRHARLKSVRSDRQPWAWHDYDASGRETVRIEQLDGSPFPELADVSPDAPLPQWCSARVTVTDYTPQEGDDAHRNDSFEPREVTAYVRRNGGAPVTVSHETLRYTREADAAGYPLRRIARTVGFGGLARTETTVEYPQDAAVPSHLRGLRTLESNADGSTTATAYAFSNGCVVATVRTRFNGAERQTYTRTVSDAAYRLPLREETRLSSDGSLLEWSERSYDDLRRLRSVAYSDGTSETNAYSCCRLLWSRDREGRTTLRSARTGTDSLYYALEEIWIKDIPQEPFDLSTSQPFNLSTGSAYRVTQHFFDGLGRETNTVTYASTLPGGASSPGEPDASSQLSRTITSYFDDWQSGASETTDERGAVTARSRSEYEDCGQSYETILTNGVEVIRTATTTWRGGGTAVRRDWLDIGGASRPGEPNTSPAPSWTEERRFTDYDAYGRRIDYVVTESSDCGVVTNSATTYDLLGRVISTAVPGANGATIVTVNTYAGATTRLLSSTTAADGLAPRTTAYLYDDSGEQVGTVLDGITNRADVAYENLSNEWWKVEATAVVGPGTNSMTVVRTQLTGLSDACRRHVVTLAGRCGSEPQTVAETIVTFDPETGIETETTTSPVAPTTIRRSLHGVLLSTENDGEKTTSGHDALGRVVATSRQMGADAPVVPVQSFNYASCGDLIASTTYTNGTDAVTETYDYDMLGNRVATTDALGGTIYKAYDPFGRVVAEWGSTYPVRHAYDTHGRRTSLSTTRDGAIWDTTMWAYDHATGLCTNKTYADGSTVAYTYTPDNLLLRTTYASGRWKENTYDDSRRLISSRSAGGSGGAGGPPAETNDVSFAYDVFGQRIAESNAVASTTYQRDAHGNCTNETTILGGPPSPAAATTNTIERAYDSYGRLVQDSLCGFAPPREISYSSDGLIAAISNAEAVVEYFYTSDRLDAGYTLTLTNGTTFTRTIVRDAYRRNLVIAITNSVNGVAIETLEYAYDALGRPISRNADAFGYNSRNEVVSASIGANLYAHSYDGIGNHTLFAANAMTNTYSANNLNQYSSILCASVPLCELSYDLDGNLLSDGVWSYAYDADGRLFSSTSASLTNGAIRVLNAYDYRHRRMSKTVQRLHSTMPPPPSPPVGEFEWRTVETHTFVYDDWHLIHETVCTIEGGVTNLSEIQHFWGLDLSGTLQGAGGVGGLLATSVNGDYYFPAYDNNGNVTKYIDESGAVVAAYEYDDFGGLISASGPMAEVFAFRFSTKYFDTEIGLYYYGYRFYSPPLMRWLNRDPIEEAGGENLYAMCGNNPICKYDLWGMVDSSQPHWDNFITIESKIAKYKKKWYKFAFGSPYLEIDITGKGRLKRFENCGELYSVQYTIVPAGGRKAFNTLGRKDDPYRLWDGDQVRTNFGWRNRFRYMVDVEFYVDGEVTRDNLWELVPNMDGNWTWDTIASKTLVRPITSGSVSLTVTVFLRNVLMDANVFTSVSDSNIVLRDHYEIEN